MSVCVCVCEREEKDIIEEYIYYYNRVNVCIHVYVD